MANGGHIALISGANRGTGAEVARQLAAKGMAVVIGARGPSIARETEETVQKEGGDAVDPGWVATDMGGEGGRDRLRFPPSR